MGQIQSPPVISGTAGVEPYETGVFTPTVTFATPGDFVPNYDAREGSYFALGNWVYIQYFMQFDTNAYTTAAGNILFQGLPFTVEPDVAGGLSGFFVLSQGFISLGTYSAAVIDALALAQVSNDSVVIFQTRSALSVLAMTTANFPPSTNNIAFRCAGWYRRPVS